MKRRTFLGVVLMFPAASRSNWIDPMALERGPTYVLSRQTPLMPAPELPAGASVDDLLRAIHAGRQLPAGALIRVVEPRHVRGTLWYRVFAFNAAGVTIGEGWVSSAALAGQRLEHWKQIR